MSLAVRLLLALGAVALFATGLVGLSARAVAERQVQASFESRIMAATRAASNELDWEARSLIKLLAPQCQHDSFADRALLDVQRVRGNLLKLFKERGRHIARRMHEQRAALRVRDLWLVLGDGRIVGSHDNRQTGSQRGDLEAVMKRPGGRPKLVMRGGEALVQVHCRRRSGRKQIGLVATRAISPILMRVGAAFGVRLALDDGYWPKPSADIMERKLLVRAIDGLVVRASISRQPLHEALARINASIFLTGAIAVLLSVALAVFVARGLAAPIMALAEETRSATQGQPSHVTEQGGRELIQLARSFNHSIEQLAAMRQRLARTERVAARREVARQIAHEIKNPLAPILAAVETLRRLRKRNAPQFDSYFDDATKTVLAEVGRIKKIVAEFTKYARLPVPRFQAVAIEELASQVVALHTNVDAPNSLSLHTEKLPKVFADPDQITQVLTNLLQNGLEAAAPHSDNPQVQVSLSRTTHNEVLLRVGDNGPGIEPAFAEQLFKPYFSTKQHGTGLGLSIVQTIVHEHGGEIHVAQSELGGAEFAVRLPIAGPPFLRQSPHWTGDDPTRDA